MTWIKLDDKAPRHPKIGGLSDKAFRWWVHSLCYASEFLTNGELSKVFWREVPKGVREELTDAKLWVFIDPNLVIHDYLEYQQSREVVEKERRRNRDRRNRERGTPDRRTAGTTAGTTAGGTGVKPRPDTDTDTDTDTDHVPPKSPASAGDLRVLERHKRQAKKVLDAHLGYCQHTDPCADRATCVNQIAAEIARAS